jgi:ABC-type phosphate transport system auxiliary subunit
MTQEEIVSSTKTVSQGLEALRAEHQSILQGLNGSLKAATQEKLDANVIEEKANLIQKSLDMIDLGLGEAQARAFVLTSALQSLTAFFDSRIFLFLDSRLWWHWRLTCKRWKQKNKSYVHKCVDCVKKMPGFAMNWPIHSNDFRLQNKPLLN